MAYQSLYRRYRPQRFAEVRGQEHLVRALRNAVAEDRVGHAYLFSGPRGTGKTSTARVLAKVLNCEKPEDGEPCCQCESCLAFEAGTSFDLHELDAASNNKVDDIRDLVDKAALGTPGRTKVYILDEVHMLTTAASNALLKTLEEPPGHVVFILATTDPQKVLATIRSRTQHFEVHLLPASELEALVRDVVDDAGLDVSDEQIAYVVREGAGSARDTLSALDQVVAAGGVPTAHAGAERVLEALVERDPGAVLVAIDGEISTGREPRVLGEQILARLRDAFLSTMGADLSGRTDDEQARAGEIGGRLGARSLTAALEALGEALIEMRQAPDPRIPLEVALVRVARSDAALSLDALAERIERLERAGPPPPGTDPPPRAAVTPKAASSKAKSQSKRPADDARQALGAHRDKSSGSKAATQHTPAVRADAPDPEPNQPAVPAPSGAAPTRDELTLAWGDTVLDGLDPPARARFKDGRFLRIDDGSAVFALPSVIHVERAEQRRIDVEGVLSAHFGARVQLCLVVDEESHAPPTEVGPTDHDPVEEIGPVDQLRDASDLEETHLQRLTDAFPGAELLTPEEGTGT
jgi:DNA polymerase-3 subunit gamma/tau